MRVYCPSCGASFGFSKRNSVRAAGRLRAAIEHVRECRTPPWDPAGSSAPSSLTWWQAKRIVLIRDSMMGDIESPWTRRPVCQSCSKVSDRTVDNALHGFADGFDVQHILPRSRGGTNDPANLAVLCHGCHVRTFSHGYAGVPGAGVTPLTEFT